MSAGAGWYRATAIGGRLLRRPGCRRRPEGSRWSEANSRAGSTWSCAASHGSFPWRRCCCWGGLLATEDRWQEALRGTVAAAVAMVPDGLVLLTSLAFITGVVALARRRALAKELASVELLARCGHALPRQDGNHHHRADLLRAARSRSARPPEPRQTEALAALASADPRAQRHPGRDRGRGSVNGPPDGTCAGACRSRRPASGPQPASRVAAPTTSARPTCCSDVGDTSDAARAKAAAASARGGQGCWW